MKKILLAGLMLAGITCTAPNTQSPTKPCAQHELSSVATIDDKELNEVSGIVTSQNHEGVFWLHEDGSNPAKVYAYNRLGEKLGSVELDGIVNKDWEDISAYDGKLWIGDIGDNNLVRENITVYSFPEPKKLSEFGVCDSF